MFYTTNNEVLDISHFDTRNVIDMRGMFANVRNVTELTLGNKFDTSNVNNMYYMFRNASWLTTINYGSKFVHKLDAKVTDMFYNCPTNKPTDPSWDGVF